MAQSVSLTRFSKSGRLLIPKLLYPRARRFLGDLVSPGLLAIAMWVCGRRAEHGIAFEQSARPKSDMYCDLLPLLNAKRVELLDNPRLASQLVALERRTARSGRDTVDHTPGGHDDLANVVAGVLVGLDLDRRPALVRQSDMLGFISLADGVESRVNRIPLRPAPP
jgi:hypothetical protein